MPDIQLNQLAEINPLRPKIDLNLTDEVSFIPMSDVSESGRWVNHQSRQFGDVSRGYTYFEEGDVLFAKITPCMENGKGCYPRNLVNGIGFASTEFHVMRAKDNADPGFIYQWSIYKPLRLKASATMIGSAGQQRVPASFLKSLKVPAIAKQEQTKIAKILSTVDRAIEQTEALIAKQQRIKTSLMQDLLTRGIDEHGNLRSEKTHPFKDSLLGRIPANWEVRQLYDLAQVDRGKFTHRPRNDPRFYGGEYPFIQTGDVTARTGRIVCSYIQTLSKHGVQVSKRFPSGTIAITIAANIGDTAILGIPMFFPDSVVGVRVRAPHSTRFIEMALRRWKPALETMAPKSAQRNINLEVLRPLLIATPPPDEQDRIAVVYEGADWLHQQYEDSQSKLYSLKTSLMQDLLTGKRRCSTPSRPLLCKIFSPANAA